MVDVVPALSAQLITIENTDMNQYILRMPDGNHTAVNELLQRREILLMENSNKFMQLIHIIFKGLTGINSNLGLHEYAISCVL